MKRVFATCDGIDIKVGSLGKRLLIWNKSLVKWIRTKIGGFYRIQLWIKIVDHNFIMTSIWAVLSINILLKAWTI